MNKQYEDSVAGRRPDWLRRRYRRTTSVNLLTALFVVFLMSAAVATLYETARQLMFPYISLWESEGITISIAALLATAAFYFALHMRAGLLMRTEAEPAARLQAETERLTLGAAIEQAGQAVVITDLEGRIQYVNPAFTRITGYGAAEALGQNPRMLKSNRQNPDFYKDLWGTILGGQVWHGELINKRKDGSTYTEEMTIAPVMGDDGAVANFVAIQQDITERRRAEAALRESEERYRSLIMNIPDLVWTMDASGHFTFVSPNIEAMSGYTQEEVYRAGLPLFLERLHPDDVAKVIEAIQALFVTGERSEVECRLRRKDGEWVWVHNRGLATYEKDGVRYAFGLLSDISKRKRAEELLRETEERFRTAFEDAPFGMCLTTLDFRYLQVNAALCQMLEYSEQELLAGGWRELTLPEDLERSRQATVDLQSAAVPSVELEKRYVCKGGDIIWVRMKISAVRNGDGKPAYYVTHVEDITERKRAEEKLRERTAYLDALIENAPLGIVGHDTEGRLQLCNPAFERLFQYRRDEIIGANVDALLAPGELISEGVAITRGAVAGEAMHRTARRRRKDGTLVDVEIHAVPLWLGGKVVGVFGLYQDITERKRAEEELAQERNLFQTLMDCIPDTIYFQDSECRFMRINKAQARMLGVADPKDAIGKTDFNFFPADFARGCYESERKLLETGEPIIDAAQRLVRPDGRVQWLSTTEVPIRDAQGKITGYVGVSRDITDRTRAEKDLEERTAYLNALVENSPVAIVVTGSENRVQLCNPAFEQLFQVRREEIVGSEIDNLIAPSPFAQEANEFSRRTAAGEVLHGTGRRRRKDGTLVDVELYGVPLKVDGRVVGTYGLYQDITLRNKVEQQLRSAKEAAEAASRAKSEFLANMSHEIRTPMNGVIGMTELALTTELNGEQREYLTLARTSAHALMRVINDILDFSKIEAKKLDLEHTAFDLRETVQQTLKPLSPQAEAKGLELLSSFEPGVPECIFGDPIRLQQILMNLVSNAIKFTERGEVDVTIRRESGSANEAMLHFSVRDTGIGISKDKQRTIFEAFVQADTSATRKFGGTGLGLTISSQLVNMIGGQLWLESEPGKGSTFHFTVPLEVASGGSETVRQPSPVRLEGLPVLAVDDNDTNRRILHAMLTRWGMAPALSESAPQALEFLQEAAQSGDSYPLIIVDECMPGMDGFTLIERIKQELKLTTATIMMLTSGPKPEDAARCRALGVAAYLTKPISEPELHAAVLRALGSQPLSAHRPKAVEPKAAIARSLRVLVVEDNTVNRLLAVRMLDKLGHAAVAAAGAREALDMLDVEPFDAVLMDVQMPDMDGFEATAMIRRKEQESGGHLTIIAMTAHAMQGDREKCLAAGMDGYVAKPINRKDLSDALERVATLPRCATGDPGQQLSPVEPVALR